MLSKFGGRDLTLRLTDLDVGRHRDARIAVEQIESAQDTLGAGVVRGDARTNQAPWCRQLVDDGDRRFGAVEQRTQGVAARRSGADQRNPKSRRQFRNLRVDHVRPARLHVRVVLVVVGVDLDEDLVPGAEVLGREDRVDGARIRTRTTVDACLRINVQDVGGAETALLRRRMDAVDRTHGYTCCVAAAGLSDDEHQSMCTFR
ncbi:Uncharacterised protein [Mycobacteroides abscessus subsp. abscessus]|nr:Uncharacterised protein [Mycobacteroides abscessus subsp. abscessus]